MTSDFGPQDKNISAALDILLSALPPGFLDRAAILKVFAPAMKRGEVRIEKLLKPLLPLPEAWPDIRGECFIYDDAYPYDPRDVFTATLIKKTYSLGAYERMLRVSTAMPVAMVDVIDDPRTSPEHKALDGKPYPTKSRFWSDWAQAPRWGCRCNWILLTRGQAEKLKS